MERRIRPAVDGPRASWLERAYRVSKAVRGVTTGRIRRSCMVFNDELRRPVLTIPERWDLTRRQDLPNDVRDGSATPVNLPVSYQRPSLPYGGTQARP